MPPEDGAEALYAMSSVTLPLEAYEVSLVELKGEILTELELESDAVMAIFHVSEPVVWHSYSFSMTPALNGDYYDQIYFSALSRQPQETADEATACTGISSHTRRDGRKWKSTRVQKETASFSISPEIRFLPPVRN